MSDLAIWLLIIAVIIIGVAVVYVLISSSMAPVFLGSRCTAESGFTCSGGSFDTNGIYDTLNFQFGEVRTSTLYNLQLACVSAYNGQGAGLAPVPETAWQTISESGAAFASGGVFSTAYALAPEGSIGVVGLRCYNETGVPLSREPNGSIFTGWLLINYSSGPCPGTYCIWHQQKAASLSVKIVTP